LKNRTGQGDFARGPGGEEKQFRKKEKGRDKTRNTIGKRQESVKGKKGAERGKQKSTKRVGRPSTLQSSGRKGKSLQDEASGRRNKKRKTAKKEIKNTLKKGGHQQGEKKKEKRTPLARKSRCKLGRSKPKEWK